MLAGAAGADYPKLAVKLNLQLQPATDTKSRAGMARCFDLQHESYYSGWLFQACTGDDMKNLRFVAVGSFAILLIGVAIAQNAAQHLLSVDELKKAVPTEFFFRGQKAPTQMRNAAGFQTASGMMTLATLVDASGYSTAIQQTYQGLLITESKINIGGSELVPGQYGFGFTADKFVVMNVANDDVLSVAFETDSSLKRPVPLKMVEDGAGYKLYAGRKWVTVKVE
jgi:hypothetical protein